MGHAELTPHARTGARSLSLDEYWMPFNPSREFKAEPRMVVRAAAMYCWNERGQGERTMFVSRERAYHGVNFGGTALSGRVTSRRRFGVTLAGIVHLRHTR